MHNLKRKYRSNELVVNKKSNFKSHLVKCQNIMNNLKFEQCIIRAMGKATPRAVNLALQLNKNNFETFELDVRTYTVEVLDDANKQPIEGIDRDQFHPVNAPPKIVNNVPAIEITVTKNKIELEKLKKLKKIIANK